MIRNNNLSVLPFYESLEEQDFRKPWVYRDGYGISVDKNHLIPFFLIVPHRTNASVSVKAIGTQGDTNAFFDGGTTTTTLDLGTSLKVINKASYDVIMFDGETNTPLGLSRGLYYLEISYGDPRQVGASVNRYSDLFVVCDHPENLVKVEWYCTEDLEYDGGVIPYSDGFVNRFYIDSQIAMPEYNFEEEGETRDGIFFASKQISQKVFKFVFVGNEALCDCLRAVRLSDVIVVTDTLGKEYKCNSFLIDTNWLDQGHYAEVNAEFETDTIIKRCGKAIVDFRATIGGLIVGGLTFTSLDRTKVLDIEGSRLFSWRFASDSSPISLKPFTATKTDYNKLTINYVESGTSRDTLYIDFENGETQTISLVVL